jgi:hypothetical protein
MPEIFACPQCSASYRWKPELAGKKIRCKKCQCTFSPDGVNPSASADAMVARVGASGGYAMLAHRASRKVATEEDELTAVHHWVMPLIVLGVGVLLRGWQVIAHSGRFQSVAIWESAGLVLVEWLLVSVAVAGGLLASAMFMEIELEKLGRAALKVVSTALLMSAVANFASSLDKAPDDLIGLILGVPCILLLAFFMLAAMFGVDLLEGLMGTVAITVAAAAVMIALALMVGGQEGLILGFGRPAVG